MGDTMVNPPHIYSIAVHGNSLAVALGSGHILVYALNNDISIVRSKQPVLTLEGHLGRIVQVTWPSFSPQLLLSVGNEPNLAMWRHGELVRRVQLQEKVNWLAGAATAPKVYLATVSTDIAVLTFPE